MSTPQVSLKAISVNENNPLGGGGMAIYYVSCDLGLQCCSVSFGNLIFRCLVLFSKISRVPPLQNNFNSFRIHTSKYLDERICMCYLHLLSGCLILL